MLFNKRLLSLIIVISFCQLEVANSFDSEVQLCRGNCTDLIHDSSAKEILIGQLKELIKKYELIISKLDYLSDDDVDESNLSAQLLKAISRDQVAGLDNAIDILNLEGIKLLYTENGYLVINEVPDQLGSKRYVVNISENIEKTKIKIKDHFEYLGISDTD